MRLRTTTIAVTTVASVLAGTAALIAQTGAAPPPISRRPRPSSTSSTPSRCRPSVVSPAARRDRADAAARACRRSTKCRSRCCASPACASTREQRPAPARRRHRHHAAHHRDRRRAHGRRPAGRAHRRRQLLAGRQAVHLHQHARHRASISTSPTSPPARRSWSTRALNAIGGGCEWLDDSSGAAVRLRAGRPRRRAGGAEGADRPEHPGELRQAGSRAHLPGPADQRARRGAVRVLLHEPARPSSTRRPASARRSASRA